jgi:hypothetical protein
MHPWESKSGEELAPVVNPADIKTAWQVYHDSGPRNPGEQVAISMNVFEHFCSPGADIASVTYRTAERIEWSAGYGWCSFR